MKYFVFSDVHGFYSIFKEALDQSGFDKTNPNHMLISIGDNFDRGQENYQMFTFLKEMKAKKKIILVKGNHEDLIAEMILRRYPLSRDLHNKTYQTLEEFGEVYFKDKDSFYLRFEDLYQKLKEDEFLDFIYDMHDYYETDHYIFTHAYIPINPDYTYKKDWRNATYQEFKEARWRNGMGISIDLDIGETGKKIVVGHWHTYYGNIRKKYNYDQTILYPRIDYEDLSLFKPYEDKNMIAIDAHTAGTNMVNILVLED